MQCYHGMMSYSPPHPHSLISLFLSSVLYCFLTIDRYLDEVMPGEYGTAKSPIFCFRPCYWRSLFRTPRGHHSMTNDEEKETEGMRKNEGK